MSWPKGERIRSQSRGQSPAGNGVVGGPRDVACTASGAARR